MKNNLRIKLSYFILFGIFVAMVFLYIFGPAGWAEDVALNVGTEVLGILLTVFLIDAVIRRHEESERVRVQNIAFRQLRIPLVHHLGLLVNAYKASAHKGSENYPTEVKNLFSDSYFVQIAFLDFSRPAPLASTMPLDWNDYLYAETRNIKSALNRTLEKYATILDGDVVELIEEVLGSSLLSFFENLVSLRELDKNQGFKRRYNHFAGSGMAELVRKHVNTFVSLVDYHNRFADPEQKIVVDKGLWRDDVAPQFASARIDSA